MRLTDSLLEQQYQLHINPEKIRSIRVMCSLGLCLYLVFIVVDLFALPSALYQAFLIRIVVISGFIIAFCLTYSKHFIQYYRYIQLVPYLLAGIGINLMIYLAEPTDKASDIYFVGLILVIMVLFAWTHLKISSVVLSSVLIIGLYVGIELSKHTDTAWILSTLVSNLFFLGSAVIIGFTTQLVRDRYLRQNFLLQHSLKVAYQAAQDNAYLANHDALTQLPNRRYMMQLLEELRRMAQKKDQVLVILFIDLNGFKQVNDIYGHTIGDEVLVIVAKRLELAVRQGDYISRLGGDEYLVGLILQKDHLIEGMVEKFVDLISQPMNINGLRIKVVASVGFAAYPVHGDTIEGLLDIADKRMYQAKKGKFNKLGAAHLELVT